MYRSYRRVSTEDQHNGPSAQADSIKSWIDRQNQTDRLMAGWVDYFDEGVSGSIPLAERKFGGQMCENLQNGDYVIVAKLDRLFRSVANAAVTIDEWCKRNITLIAIAENFDMSTPMGRAMAQMACVFAELERQMIRARTKDALAAKKSRGECVGEVPYGWDKVGNVLAPNEREQHVITAINTARASGYSIYKIAKQLNDSNITAKKGGKWSITQVHRLLA